MARFVVGAALVVGGWLSFHYFEQTSANDLALGITLVALVAAVLGAGFYFLRPRGWHDSNKLESNLWWLIPGVIALGFLVTAVTVGHNSRQPGGHLYSYCAYGAVSRAQLQGCLDHVKDRSIDDMTTNAADFANRRLDECLADAGPFCEQARYARELADEAPPPGQ
jgi:ABC-type Fe3+-siderophore transport system permease subunit